TVDEYQLRVPTWIRVATAGNAPYTANLFCSLLSVVCSTDTSTRGVFGIFGNAEVKDMVSSALQLLVILLDFNVGVFVLPDGTEETEGAKGEKGGRRNSPALRNVFRSMLSGVHRPEELDFIFDGLTHHLASAASRSRTSSVSEKPDLFCEQLLILTWHLLTLNGHFLRHVCSRRGADALLRPLIALLLDASFFIHRRPTPQTHDARPLAETRDSLSPSTNGGSLLANDGAESPSSSSPAEAATALSRIGLLHMCSFILLVLSSERDFAVRLNEPFLGKAPADIPVFQGSYADLLCLAVHRVVMDATGPRGSSDSLVDMLLTVLCNVSAYVKSFCLESCLRLMAMMERLTRRYWLFSAPQHYHDVFFLLDVFNNLIQYQFEGNCQLVYAILRQKKIFCDLENLSLPASLRRNSRRETKEGEDSTACDRPRAEGSLPSSHGNGGDGGTDGGAARHREEREDEVNGDNKGKRDDERSDREDEDDSLAGDEDRWEPTEEWLDEWKHKLPLQTILRLIQCLLPQVEEECARREVTDQQDILAFLEKTTMVGLLPVPHPIIIRNYQPNAYTALWFTSFMWGVLLVSSAALHNVARSRIRLIVMNP
ncbi:high-temperature-induced dauer-formation protein, partial [Toxoplasma gondii p89]